MKASKLGLIAVMAALAGGLPQRKQPRYIVQSKTSKETQQELMSKAEEKRRRKQQKNKTVGTSNDEC
jgi:hypothetical protein